MTWVASKGWQGLLAGALLWLPGSLPAADADWLSARDAYRQGNVAAFTQAADALQGSVLQPYVPYWQLLFRIETASDAEVRRYLAQQATPLLAQRVRVEWLRRLAKRQDWKTFQQHFAELDQAPEIELQCLFLQSQLALGQRMDAARYKDAVWLTGKDQLSVCDPVITAWQNQGVISEEDRWLRLRLALEAGSQPLVRFLLRSPEGELPNVEDLRLVAEAPTEFITRADLGRRDQRELAAWAYGRWARRDLPAAVAMLESDGGRLGKEAVVAWRQIALAAARELDPRSERFFALSEKAWWPVAHHENRFRLLVRYGRWPELLALQERVPAAVRERRDWQYWHAVASLQLPGAARHRQARETLRQLIRQDDYYGLLAREQLGLSLPAAQTLTVDPVASDRVRASPGVQRALALFALNQRVDANNEWQHALRGVDEAFRLAAAEVAEQAGWLDRAILAAELMTNPGDLDRRFPMPHRDLADASTRDAGLELAWVYGLIRQESRFMPAARSHAGAGGLMQLMPGTAQWVADRLGEPWQAERVNDIATNMRYGSYYLRHVLDELGHPVLATAGYNAGPRRALAWQADVPMPATQYVESIPFGETRDYVKKVMTNAVHYSRRLGTGEIRLLSRLGSIPARQPAVIEGP